MMPPESRRGNALRSTETRRQVGWRYGAACLRQVIVILTLFLLVLAGGAFATRKRVADVDFMHRRELLRQAVDIAAAVAAERYFFSLGPEDSAAPRFEILRDQLTAYGRMLGVRRIYGLELLDGALEIWPASDAGEYPPSAAPGSDVGMYASEAMEAFHTGRPVVTDRRSRQGARTLSAFAPVHDESGEVALVIGLDACPEVRSNQQRAALLFPLGGTLLLAFLVLAAGIVWVWGSALPTDRIGCGRSLEICLVMIAGIAMSVLLMRHVRDADNLRRSNTFEQLAALQSQRIQYALNVLDTRIDGLANLFEASEFVDREEFRIYVATLLQDRSALAYAWAPRLSTLFGNALAWPLEPLSPGALWDAVYPIRYMEPRDEFDGLLGSDAMPTAACRRVAEQALLTARPGAACIEIADSMGKRLVLRAYMPVGLSLERSGMDADEPEDLQHGFVMAVLDPRGILHDALERNFEDRPLFVVSLTQVSADAESTLLAVAPEDDGRDSANIGPDARGRGLRHTLPIFSFGAAFVVTTESLPAFKAVYRSNAPLLAGAAGVALTFLIGALMAILIRRAESLERQVLLRTAQFRESERRLTTLMNNLPGMAYSCRNDRRWTMLFVSDGCYPLTGYAPEELIENAVAAYGDLINPDDRDHVWESIQEQVTARRAFQITYRIVSRSGEEKWVWEHGVGVYRNEDQQITLEGFLTDISQQKKAEIERRAMDMRLREAQRFESLGTLAGGIAHDFNNILMVVLGHSDLALLDLQPESPVRPHIESIMEAARHAVELSNQMLAYSGRGHFVINELDLNCIIEDMLHLLKSVISKHAVLDVRLEPDLPKIAADAAQMGQVVMSLVVNASEALGDQSGAIDLATGVMWCDRDLLSETCFEETLSEGLYVSLKVADTGCGMDDETRARIFEPFFSTKFTGRGLGLPAVLGIVRGHKGTVRIESEIGRGSVFTLLFPVASESVKAKHPDKTGHSEF